MTQNRWIVSCIIFLTWRWPPRRETLRWRLPRAPRPSAWGWPRRPPGGTLVLRKQVFFFDISKNVRGIYEILCAARYMSNELIFQISASWVIGKHPGGKFCEMQFLQCKMTQIGHFQGMIKRVSRGCLMVSIILTRQDMSIFRWSGEILKKNLTGLA